MEEYRWKWMKPDKTGVWMFGGNGSSPSAPTATQIRKPEAWNSGWFCFISPITENDIQMHPKKTVTKRLWLRQEESLPDDPGYAVYQENWAPVGERMDLSDGWIFTEKKKEVEE